MSHSAYISQFDKENPSWIKVGDIGTEINHD